MGGWSAGNGWGPRFYKADSLWGCVSWQAIDVFSLSVVDEQRLQTFGMPFAAFRMGGGCGKRSEVQLRMRFGDFREGLL